MKKTVIAIVIFILAAFAVFAQKGGIMQSNVLIDGECSEPHGKILCEAKGVYTHRGEAFGKPYYNLAEQPDYHYAYSIFWFEDRWHITNEFESDWYSAEEDVAFPWLVTTWVIVDDIVADPQPSVTEVP